MSDDIPEPDAAALAIDISREFTNAVMSMHSSRDPVIRMGAETRAALACRCHAAESALAAARRTIATLEAERDELEEERERVAMLLIQEEELELNTAAQRDAATAERDSLRERLDELERFIKSMGMEYVGNGTAISKGIPTA